MVLIDIDKISYDPNTKGYLVMLRSFEDNDCLEILVNTKNAKQISLAKEGINLPRPSSHDLLLDIIDRFNIKLKKIIINEPIDFAQFNYSLGEREAENRLLPLCADQGVATIINRPFMRAKLFSSVKGKVLPSWCNNYGIGSWGQFFLKYIISHPAVTNIIPATSKPKHMLDNSLAGIGRIPDSKIKRKMLEIL